MVWNEKLKRNIPFNWANLKVKDCIYHINTGLNPRDNFVLGNGNIRYITVKNLTTNGTIDFLNCDVIDQNAQKLIHNRSKVSKGDILFASIAPLGRCHIVMENPIDWEINESVFSIRPKLEVVTSEYLYMYFISSEFVKKAEHSSTGSVFNGIRITTLEDMDLIIPKKEVLNLYQTTVEKLFLKKHIIEKENSELIVLRNYLLPLLMNGKITIK